MDAIYTNFLTQLPIFGGINSSLIELIEINSNLICKEKDDAFFREDELADSLFVLLKGQVVVYKLWEKENHRIAELNEGDCFGEMAIIDHCPRSASVIANAPSTAMEISVTCFDKLYHEDVKQYALFQMNMAREVSRRLREANEHLFQSQFLSSALPPVKIKLF